MAKTENRRLNWQLKRKPGCQSPTVTTRIPRCVLASGPLPSSLKYTDPTMCLSFSRCVQLLGRFFSLLYSSHPSLSRGGSKKRYTIAPQREGSKRTLFANIEDICKKMHRQPEHVIQFLFAELGTSGSVDGSKRLVIKGRFQQKQIENVLRRYIGELRASLPPGCRSPWNNELMRHAFARCSGIRYLQDLQVARDSADKGGQELRFLRDVPAYHTC